MKRTKSSSIVNHRQNDIKFPKELAFTITLKKKRREIMQLLNYIVNYNVKATK